MTTATRDFIGTHRATLAPLLAEGDHAAAWEERLDEVRSFADLDDDWDGLGARGPLEGVVEGALTLGRLLCEGGATAPLTSLPGRTGTVLFEWQDERGSFELEVTGSDRADWLVLRSGKEPESAVIRW